MVPRARISLAINPPLRHEIYFRSPNPFNPEFHLDDSYPTLTRLKLATSIPSRPPPAAHHNISFSIQTPGYLAQPTPIVE
jgi:hypothetical protein